jgi:26S proteasome non-ATPase regulatory subunit 9
MTTFGVDAASPRARLLELDKKRARLEAEMQALVDDLNSPGLSGEPPAGTTARADVDAEGFPRADIDLYATRDKRHRLNILRNDLKALMATLETSLHELHSLANPAAGAAPSAPAAPARVVHTEPFATVQEVLPDSPAAFAGLHTGDRLLSFADVHAGNHRHLSALAEVVRDSVGKAIQVRVQRGEKALALEVTPKPWAGRGVLGCNFVPTSQ